MKNLLLFVSCVLIFLPVNSFAQQRKNDSPEAVRKLETDIPVLMRKADIPGISVAFIKNGKLNWNKTFGVKNAETKEPFTGETIFEAASLSKPVFAYAVLKLVEGGKLDLDAPLNKYLGNNYDVGEDARLDKITARNVLSHTTGFPNWRNRDAKSLPILFTPGERFSYSGEGFEYLQKAVEQITKTPLEDFMRKTVFVPLKMNSSTYVWNDRAKALKANRHDSLGNFAGRGENMGATAAASLLTTAEDYAKFLIAVLDGKDLSKRLRREMLAPQIRADEKCVICANRPLEKLSTEIGWGLGVGLETTNEGTSFWHWGDNGNVKAYFIVSDKTKDGFVFFANGANGLSILDEIVTDTIGGRHPAVKWLDYERYDSPARRLLKAILEKGANQVLEKFFQNEKEKPSEKQMNQLGYTLFRLKKNDDAIAVLTRNTLDYPQSGNVWDSLADVYMNTGNRELAIKYYEKAVQINPENKSAVEILNKLKNQ